QIAGTAVPRLAARIPATNVPCVTAAPFACGCPRSEACERIWMLSVARSGCVAATEPSINPTITSGLPAVRSIKAVRFTALNGDRLAGILAAATMTDTRDYCLVVYHTHVLRTIEFSQRRVVCRLA